MTAYQSQQQHLPTFLNEYEEYPYHPQYTPRLNNYDQIVIFIVVFVMTLAFLFVFFLPRLVDLNERNVPDTEMPASLFTQPTNTNGEYKQAGPILGGANAQVAQISPVFSPEVQVWEPKILAWASLHQLNPNLVATIMQVESCGNPNAHSPAGAQGLFQVMPFHFTPGENMLDPDTNARRGMNYFVERLEQTNGNFGKSFAGYNGGHVAAGTDYGNWVAETQRYYHWTTGIIADINAGQTSSTTLQKWMAAGGASLCRQAAQTLGLNQ